MDFLAELDGRQLCFLAILPEFHFILPPTLPAHSSHFCWNLSLFSEILEGF